MKTQNIPHRSLLSFTFHYASTLYSTIIIEGDSIIDLHSTMLLLYGDDFAGAGNAEKNLHSTMLLLYFALYI